MDIDLPGMSGMEAAGLMRAYDEETPLIFVTNLAQYAIRGYEVDALDFIVKPVSWYHFSMRMDKAMRAMRRHSATGRLKVSTRSGVRVIPPADVLTSTSPTTTSSTTSATKTSRYAYVAA